MAGWPEQTTCTERNRFGMTPFLATCISLRRMACPFRWRYVEEMFGKSSSHYSEHFWEMLETFLETHEHLIVSPLDESYLQAKLTYFADFIFQKNVLSNCVAFIDGTVIGVSRTGHSGYHHVLYNGHARKHALTYQAVLTPDGILLHVYGPLEERKHDWTLYTRSGLEEQLPNCMQLQDGTYFCIYGDSGYSRRWYLYISFQGSFLSPDQSSFNEAISAVRVAVEWIFKEEKYTGPPWISKENHAYFKLRLVSCIVDCFSC